MEKALSALLALAIPAQAQAMDGVLKVPLEKTDGHRLDGAVPIPESSPPDLPFGDLQIIAGTLYSIHRILDLGIADDCQLSIEPSNIDTNTWIYEYGELELDDPQKTKIHMGPPVYGNRDSLSFMIQRGDKLMKLSHIPEQCEPWRKLAWEHQYRMNEELSTQTSCHFETMGVKGGGNWLTLNCSKSTRAGSQLTHYQPPSR